MVGQLGSSEIAAVGLSNQVFFIMNLMVFGTVSGGSIFIAQYWGKKDISGIHRTTGIMLRIAGVISAFFFLTSFFFPQLWLKLYTADAQVIEKGKEYLKIVSPSFLLYGIITPVANAERSTEHVILPAVATIVSVLANTVLNYLFIFGLTVGSIQVISPHGIAGAAVATDISRIIELVIVILFAYVRKFEIAVNPKKYFVSETGFFAKYVKICIPVLVNETLWGTGISMQSSIFAHSGTYEVAAFNIMATISNLLYPICLGCGSAAAIIIGKTIGEGKLLEAKSLSNKLCAFISGMALVLGFLLIPLSKTLPVFFKVEEAVLQMAAVFLYIKCAAYAFDAFNMVSVVGVFRAGGDTLFALIMDVGFMWLVAIPLGWLAVKVWALPYWAVYLCILTEPVFKSILGIIRLKSGKWLKDNILEQN